MKKLSGQSILVLGAGASGCAAARLAMAAGAKVSLLDSGRSDALCHEADALRAEGLVVRLGWQDTSWPEHCDLAVISPGITGDGALGRLAAGLTCPVQSELAFGAGFCPWPMLAVTGTNGKTTTVEMLTHALSTAGLRVVAGGNIGMPLSALALARPELDWLVVEVSSFQLERPEGFAPRAAALLNITPDHLNRHGSMDAYLALKMSLLSLLPAGQPAVLHVELLSDERVCRALAGRPCLTFSGASGSTADYALGDGQLWRRGMDRPLVAVAELPFQGRHNLENAMAALAIAESAGIDCRRLLPGLSSFRTGEHRLSVIAEKAGRRFVDDSKATNVDALLQALAVFGGNGDSPSIALIAGGVDKGCSLDEVRPALKRHVKKVFLIGACRDRLAASWGRDLPCECCVDLPEAVRKAAQSVDNGGTVLLSPACASQDMFTDYAHRGRVFADTVAQLIGS